jgi:hypothetical protein
MPDGDFTGVTIDGEAMSAVYNAGTEDVADLADVPAGVPVELYRQGDRAFFKTGGAGLNFKIVGGTARPTTGLVENLIWVNTAAPITGYVFDHANPTLPVTAAYEGVVIIGLNYASAISFNALKTPFIAGTSVPKRAMQVYIGGAYHCLGGVRVRCDAWIYQGGAWKQLVDIMPLYTDGVQNVPWSQALRGAAGVGFEANRILLGTANAAVGEASVVTTAPIDITPYKYLRGWVAQVGYPLFNGFGVRTTNQNFNETNGWTAYTRLSAAGAFAVDISGLSGSYYVAATNWNNGNTALTNVVLTNMRLTID